MFLVLLCYAKLLVLSCHKNFSAQSDLVLVCVPDNKRLELEHFSTCTGFHREDCRLRFLLLSCIRGYSRSFKSLLLWFSSQRTCSRGLQIGRACCSVLHAASSSLTIWYFQSTATRGHCRQWDFCFLTGGMSLSIFVWIQTGYIKCTWYYCILLNANTL